MPQALAKPPVLGVSETGLDRLALGIVLDQLTGGCRRITCTQHPDILHSLGLQADHGRNGKLLARHFGGTQCPGTTSLTNPIVAKADFTLVIHHLDISAQANHILELEFVKQRKYPSVTESAVNYSIDNHSFRKMIDYVEAAFRRYSLFASNVTLK